MKSTIGVSAIAFAIACTPATQPPPGDEIIGKFDFVTDPIENTCPPFPEIVDGGFFFQGTFSRVADGGQSWLTLSSSSEIGTFDGQFLSTSALINRERRRFEACSCEDSEVGEALNVALLSRSQNDAVRDRASDGCPQDALDGGLPLPDPDAGITPPGTTPSGFDAVRACGTLTDYIYGRAQHPRCSCEDCKLVYRLSGIRR